QHRMGIRSASRKTPKLSGRFRAVTLPAAQSALPDALAVSVLITHVLVPTPECEEFGIGSGGPKRQPALVHLRRAHLALLQAPSLHVPSGVQSALAAHVDPQSLSARHEVPRFDDSPWMQRLPPASAGDVPEIVS